MADPENFGGGDLKHKTSKIRMSSPKLRVIFWLKLEIQTFFSPKFRWSPKKKKKKVFTKIETDFSPDSLRLGRWGGMHPEMEPNYSKQRLIFRPKSLLLGWWGDASPPIPPLNPPLHVGRQTCRLWFPWSHKGNPCSRDSLWLSLLQGFSDFFACFFFKYHKWKIVYSLHSLCRCASH